MGFREVLVCVFLLLLSGFHLPAASQTFNSSTNETLNTHGPAEPSPQLPRALQPTGHQSNSGPPRSPVSYRLKVYQIWNPAVRKHMPVQDRVEQKFPIPQVSEAGQVTSEQLEVMEVFQEELIQGPDLNPPIPQEEKVHVKVEQRVPVPADSVAVHCGEAKVTVKVNQNFLGNGQLIRRGDLTLGGCAALDAPDHAMLFKVELHSCASTLAMTEDALIYTFTLTYAPTPISNTVILRTNVVQVLIQCQYKKILLLCLRLYVSSGALRPSWSTFASSRLAEQQLHFSLRLMTDDWKAPRSSSVYFLSDVMHVEATVLQGHHVPMRVYVDSCVATVTSDPQSQPRYTFINNHGCLTDAKLTGGTSYFMQRRREDQLDFQLKAFRFDRDPRNSLYITCHLKATTLSVPISSQNKACSYLTEANRWVASGGDNEVCECCASNCSETRRRRSPAADHGLEWEGTAALGPILLEEPLLQVEEAELHSDPALLLQTTDVTPTAASSSLTLLCGASAALALLSLLLLSAVVIGRVQKHKELSVCT